MRTDAITAEVIRHGFETIAQEMGDAIRRTSLSVVVKDMRDYACALFDPHGKLLAAALDIPALIASMAPALQACVERLGGDVSAGDVLLINDPYRGACQTNDINVFVPVFDTDDTLIGYTGTIAHHVEWGGRIAGTASSSSRSSFEEGIMIPGVKLYRADQLNVDLLDLLLNNTRTPEMNRGDLRAQVAAARSGARRLLRMAERYGTRTILDAQQDLLEYTATRTRLGIERLPDGVYSAEGFLDDDGLGPGEPVRLAVSVTIEGGHAHFDFTGTDPQMSGGTNIPTSSTQSAVHYAVKCFIDDDIPFNEGALDPISIEAPLGTAVNPRFPAAVGARHLAAMRLASVITRAIAQADPERSSAEWFVGFPCFLVESTSPKSGQSAVLLAAIAGGAGAASDHDGSSVVDAHLSNCPIIPAEVIESNYLLGVERYELIPGSGGVGEFRGGLGMRAEYRNLSDRALEFMVESEQMKSDFAPQGLSGGAAGTPAAAFIIGVDGAERRLPAKGRYTVGPGEVLRLESGGGGGFGDSANRSAQSQDADVRHELLSAASA